VTASLSGFAANTSFGLIWSTPGDERGKRLTFVKTNGAGTGSKVFKVPTNAAPGQYTVVVVKVRVIAKPGPNKIQIIWVPLANRSFTVTAAANADEPGDAGGGETGPAPEAPAGNVEPDPGDGGPAEPAAGGADPGAASPMAEDGAKTERERAGAHDDDDRRPGHKHEKRKARHRG
jgi:hypothetical protein